MESLVKEGEIQQWILGRLDKIRVELRAATVERANIDRRVTELYQDLCAAEKFLSSQFGQLKADKGSDASERILNSSVRFVGMSMADAAAEVLSNSDSPLHARDILEKLEAGGLVTFSAKPVNTLVAALSRNKRRFNRTAPNTFTLAQPLDSEDESCPDGQAQRLWEHVQNVGRHLRI